MLAKPDNSIAMHALRTLQMRVGGEIREGKLLPIGPYLTALCPLEPASNLQRRWHVVQVQSQQEKDVAERLKSELKLDSYNPVESRKVRAGTNKYRTTTKPMLTGYVFAGFDVACEDDRWQSIISTRGVIRLLKFGELPIPVPQKFIDHFVQLEQERSLGPCCSRQPITMDIGVMVRTLDPLSIAGLFGIVVGIDHKKRLIMVEIEFFGRKVPFPLTPEQVETI